MIIGPNQANAKGTYIFFSQLPIAKEICINQKGRTHHFQCGWYAYVGSAFGPGGLKSRLNRHFYGSGRAHWNIDFFRQGVLPHNTAWVSCYHHYLESRWAAVFQLMQGVLFPVANFGNADRRGTTALPGTAATHLFHLRRKPRMVAFQTLLDEHFPGAPLVCAVALPI